MEEKLSRILDTRIKFMRKGWTDYDIKVLKTLIRIEFYTIRSKDGREFRDFRTTEYPLNPTFDIDGVIADQQRKLGRDVIEFVGQENMDELLEVLVG